MVHNKKEFNRRVYLRLLGRPGTAISAVATVGFVAIGTIAAMAGFHSWHLFTLAALAGTGCLGTIGYNFMFRTEQVVKEIQANMQRELESDQDRELNKLARRLEADDDHRDDMMLAELREQIQWFHEKGWADGLNSVSVSDMQSAAKEMFNTCVDALRRSVDLQDKALRLPRNSPARARLQERREKYLNQVRTGINGLGELYAEVQEVSADRALGRDADKSSKIHSILDRFQEAIDIDRAVEGDDDQELNDQLDRELA